MYSTRTLIIGLAKRPTNTQIMIEAHVTGSLSSDLLQSNYVGQLARARLAKQTLDDQVKRLFLDKCFSVLYDIQFLGDCQAQKKYLMILKLIL